MAERFTGKTAVVLGGNAGIGLATARQLAAEGAKVAITGRDRTTLDAAAAEFGALALQVDMADIKGSEAAFAEIVGKLGKIDALFVNAGVGGFSSIVDMTEEFWDHVHSVNLKGAVFAARGALPHINDGGSILFTGSIGSVLATRGNVVYAAAKAGLRAAARIFAAELLPRNIRVNLISPGPIDTEIFKRGATQDEIAAMRERMNKAVPMKRMGSSDEVANAALFLLSDEASFINGVDLYVDGGVIELLATRGSV
jgi:NAD(P)-dependent dehydrogenase (short-subunit alcohol dehydrogenase family)